MGIELIKTDDGQELYRAKIINTINIEKDIEGKALGDDEIEMIGSTEGLDSDGESMDMNGAQLKRFKANPVILPQHNYSKPAIGKATKIQIKDGKLIFKIKFPSEGTNPEADVYRKLYKEGFMKASSIGFIPKEWVDGDGKKSPYRKFTKWELLELSLVSVPANPEALVSAKSKGVVSDEELKIIGIELPKEEKGTDPTMLDYEEHQKLHEQIKKSFAEVKNSIAYILGVLNGMGKSQDNTSKEEPIEEQNKSYMDIILSVNGDAKSNDAKDTDEDKGLKSFLLKKPEKGLKQFLIEGE